LVELRERSHLRLDHLPTVLGHVEGLDKLLDLRQELLLLDLLVVEDHRDLIQLSAWGNGLSGGLDCEEVLQVVDHVHVVRLLMHLALVTCELLLTLVLIKCSLVHHIV
jgi:hypothetical protein